MSMPRSDFIAALPKAELHLHIEGSFEPELMLQIAKRNGVALRYDSVEALRSAYAFNALQDFLDIYYQGMAVLLHEQDFYDLTMAYCQRAHADGVRHTEIFFDPQAHLERGIRFATVVDGISAALDDARSQFGLSSALIMCFLRHLPESSAFETLEMALTHRDRVIGVGLDSSELGHPPGAFMRVFEAAREAGMRCVAHAGEEGPPQYVRDALELLHVDRIDHGNRALEDAELIGELAARGVPLTLCPLSNLRLCVIDEMAAHPVRTMLELGLKATINSDDPAYFGGYINANFEAVSTALDLSEAELFTLARNSFEAAFTEPAAKQAWLNELDAMAGSSPKYR